MLTTTCVCAKLRRSARIVTAFYDEALASCDLTVAQFSLLRMLQRAGPCSLTALARATGHDRTTLNRTLRPLEVAGFVHSAPGEDQRARMVEITDKAKDVMRRAHPHWELAQEQVHQALGGEEAKLFTLLDRIEKLQA